MTLRDTRRLLFWALLPLLMVQSSSGDEPRAADPGPWKRSGKLADPNFFPIAVWLQNPSNAQKYRQAGINVYVGLWRGPTDEQLTALKRQEMLVVCSQNRVGLAHRDDPTILAWMHGDEPDNAQSLGRGKGYGPPIPPEKIVAGYRKIRAADPSRPVLLNLGQGVAWDGWHGRGVRTNHPEDYPEYVRGCDIASFDIYPACHDHPDVKGKLWFVADGVRRLREWTDDRQLVWNCIECTHISNPPNKATPQQVKAEVWMSLVRGSQGLIYFVHQFQPNFIEAGLLADEDMLAKVTETNHQIHQLAPVLNSPSVADLVSGESSNSDVPVEFIVKQHGGETYIFAVCMRGESTSATFRAAAWKSPQRVEVLGENRQITTRDGAFSDDFAPWDVHLYRLTK